MSTIPTASQPKNHHALQCMEIWSGNQAVSRSATTPGLDIWVYSRPYEHATDGGDVHYVSLCGGGVITRFILADISGHGAAVANVGRSLRDLMRRNINRKSQGKLVQELNRQFAELAKLKRFATAIVATYLAQGDTLSICNAGHPRPLWYRVESREWIILAGNDESTAGLVNLPLGIDDSTVYPQATLTLGKGDLVLMYTDALVEAENAAGQQIGESGLLELVRQLDVSDASKIPEALNAAITSYRGTDHAGDDQTFLLLHHNAGRRKRLSVMESLDVYAKVLHLKAV